MLDSTLHFKDHADTTLLHFYKITSNLVGLYQSFIWQINTWRLIGLNNFPKSLMFIENWKWLLLYSFAPQRQWRSKQDRHYYDLHVPEEKTEAQKSELQEQECCPWFSSFVSHVNEFFYFAFLCLAQLFTSSNKLLLKKLHHANARERGSPWDSERVKFSDFVREPPEKIIYSTQVVVCIVRI